jgi:uncharacterized protein with FMN-binding domain
MTFTAAASLVRVMHGKPVVITIWLFAVAVYCSACDCQPDRRSLKHKKLVDGTYTDSYKGGPNKAGLKITIEDNTIVHIQIVEQWALKGRDAERI